MHPQIRRPAPGNCPICGMALEPEMPSLDDERNPELEDFTRRFRWTLPLTIVGVAIAMGGHRFGPVVFAGWPFFVDASTPGPNMWTLIGTASQPLSSTVSSDGNTGTLPR
jgi:Cu+-exporting ATPase